MKKKITTKDRLLVSVTLDGSPWFSGELVMLQVSFEDRVIEEMSSRCTANITIAANGSAANILAFAIRDEREPTEPHEK